MPKVARIVKRHKTRALGARSARENVLALSAFHNGVAFGAEWEKSRIALSTKDLTYD